MLTKKQSRRGQARCQSAVFEALESRQMFSGYAVTDLGVGLAKGINDRGEVVGNVPGAAGTSTDAAYWTASGQEYDINWGGAGGTAYAINNSGEIVGFGYQDAVGGIHGFRINIRDHDKIGGTDFTYGDDSSDATNEFFSAIDNSFIGLTVGYSYTSKEGLFFNGDTYPVAGLPGDGSSTIPLGIANYNMSTGDTPIVGQSGGHAFYNSGSTSVDLSAIGVGPETGEANGISPNGNYVVGDTGNLPFVYFPSSSDMLDLAFSGSGSAAAVNDNGEIVGSFSVGSDTHAFCDYRAQGLVDLNSLLPANSGWDLQFATGINASGQICGYGTYDGQQHAFLLNPGTQGPTVDTVQTPANITSQSSQAAEFAVQATDPLGVDSNSLTAEDFTISGPSGKTATIEQYFGGGSGATTASSEFGVVAPGGTWTHADNGTYTVSLNSDAIDDGFENYSPAQTLFSFTVDVPLPATAPTLSSVSASPNSVLPGTNVSLTADGVSDINNNLSSVSFYRESNGKPGLQTGTGGDTLISTDTSSSGGWTGSASTTGLAAGTYTYYAQAKDTTGLLSTVASTTVTVQPSGSIAGTVFSDANGNGSKDSSDAVLSGWRVYLDTNKDGVYETSEKSVITSSTGTWSFSNLPLGTYRVREVPETGWRLTTPSAGYYDITLSSSTPNVTAKLFGDTQSVTISGTVFADTNANGKQDSTEKGVSGWTVYLDTNNDGKLTSGEKTVVTDSNGNFSFAGLTAGTYIVRVVPKGTAKITDPGSGNYLLTITAGQVKTGLLFGEH